MTRTTSIVLLAASLVAVPISGGNPIFGTHRTFIHRNTL